MHTIPGSCKWILLLIILTACTSPYVIIGDKKIIIEIADTPEKHSLGLMYREQLDENSGMLFIYNNSAPRTFWMKNTLIPLDIIFVNNESILSIKENALPCKTENCELYTSVADANMVLEVNSEFVKKNNISVGDKFIVKE